MRYFTNELWSKINSQSQKEREEANIEWEENDKTYSAIFEIVKDRLSKKYLEIYFRNHGFHDFQIKNIVLSHQQYGVKNPISVEIYITNGSETYKIAYKSVTKFDINYESDIEAKRGFDDWGYDEFLPIDELFISHEILFASGATIFIYFKNKNVFIDKIKEG